MTIDPTERLNLTMCAGALAASWVWASPGFAWSLAVGAALEAANFRGLRRSSEALFAGRLPGPWSAGFAVRFLGLAVGIGAALSFMGSEIFPRRGQQKRHPDARIRSKARGI